jgi:hypothetical protein
LLDTGYFNYLREFRQSMGEADQPVVLSRTTAEK